MHLHNRYQGYFKNGSEYYHGKIIITDLNELTALYKYLFHPSVIKDKFYRKLLKEDWNNIEKTRKGYQFTVRVTATEKLVKHFNLKGYKRVNYLIEVR